MGWGRERESGLVRLDASRLLGMQMLICPKSVVCVAALGRFAFTTYGMSPAPAPPNSPNFAFNRTSPAQDQLVISITKKHKKTPTADLPGETRGQ